MKNIEFFKDICPKTIKDLTDMGEIYTSSHPKNSEIHESGSLCTTVDIVLEGALCAYVLTQNGSENIVFTFKKNDVVGANLIFGERNFYPMSIYSTTDCKLLHITKTGIGQLLHDYNFVMKYVKFLSLNSQGMNQKIKMHTQKTLRENLLEYLHQLVKEQNSNEIILPITKNKLANYFGVQRPSLFRELKKMKDEQLISVQNRKIIIYKP